MKYDVQNINESIDPIVNILKKGGIMIYPTETVAGIGCIGSDMDPIRRLYEIKRRDTQKPVSFAFSSIDMVKKYAIIPNKANKMLQLFPGPITLILPLRSDAPKLYGIDSVSIGVRIPNVPWLLELIEKLGEPIVTTSANISHQRPYTAVKELPQSIIEEINILVSWEGSLDGLSSTVISMVGVPKILRQGAIPENEILSLLQL